MATSLGADVVRRSCWLSILQTWIHTVLLGKYTQQANATYSAAHGWRPSQQCWGGRFHSNCCSCCSHPCSCIRWWCLYHAYLGAESTLPSTSRNLWRWWRKVVCLPALTTSGGMPSFPGALPQARESMAFLSSSTEGGTPSSSKCKVQVLLTAESVTVFTIKQSSR